MTTKQIKQMSLGARIRWARNQTGLSQENFAASVGTSRRHVMRWENEGRQPGPAYRARIAEVTGQPEELFVDEDDEESAVSAEDLFATLLDLARARKREKVLA